MLFKNIRIDIETVFIIITLLYFSHGHCPYLWLHSMHC